MKTVKYDVTYKDEASRLELFIRWIWMIPSAIVLIVLAIIASVAWFVQWFHILILGKKNKTLFEWMIKYYKYEVKLMAYMNLLTEERSPIMPEE